MGSMALIGLHYTVTAAAITGLFGTIAAIIAAWAAVRGRREASRAAEQLYPNGGNSLYDAVNNLRNQLAATTKSVAWVDAKTAAEHRQVMDAIQSNAEALQDTNAMLLRHLESAEQQRVECGALFARVVEGKGSDGTS